MRMINEDEDFKIDIEEKMESTNQESVRTKPAQKTSNRVVSLNASNIDAKAAVDELLEKTEMGWKCKPCGKITKSGSSNIRKHAEIHIDGLSFECQMCHKTFRSRVTLNNHMRHHI